jgi:murein L,D-transpeptidase YcbB/YkuD
VLLKNPVPVHLQYWTAWVDEEGQARFVDDIYQRDAPLAAALRAGIRR